MTREQAKQEIRSRYKEYLQPAKKKNTYICPLCNNGTGTDGDGITVDPHGDGHRLHCFKCGFHGDIIDLYQQQQSCTIAEAFEGLYSYFNMDIENTATESHQKPQEVRNEPQAANYTPEEKTDYTAYFKACRERMNTPAALEYLSFRGISPETAERFWIGCDPEWRSPAAVKNGKNPPASPRLIIPTSASSYIARETRQEPSKYAKMKEGEVNIFNAKALYNEQESPVFITEGEIDALSIIEAGKEAVGLGSVNNKRKFIEQLKEKTTSNTLILCLDKDEAGQKAEQAIANELQRLNIAFIRAKISGEYKDPNEALTADKAAFVAALEAAERKADGEHMTGEEMLNLFLEETGTQRYKPISTGLQSLDTITDGGLIRQTLVFLGAAPGAGKTALATMIFEEMAKQGKQCLYLNLEMSRNQLLARSLSRIIYKQCESAMSATTIMKGYQLTPEQKMLVNTAVKIYKEDICDNMLYNPEGLKPDLDSILSLMEKEATRAERKGYDAPIVCIDYLQLISGRQREDGTEVIKRAVAEFKEYARKHNSIVFVIMAQSRKANKSSEADMASGRDTSAIEYSADLQLQLIKDEDTGFVTLYVTKNRFGNSNTKKGFDFNFIGAASLFEPVEKYHLEPVGKMNRVTRRI